MPEWSLERRRLPDAPDAVRTGRVPPAEPPEDASELRTLFRISQAVGDAHFFDEGLEAIAEETLRSCGGSSLSISRWERDVDCLRTLINVGVLGPGEVRWPVAELYSVASDPDVAELVRRGRPYVNSIDDERHPAALACLRRFGKESEVGVPIAHGDAVWGEIWMAGSGGRRFHDADLRLLQAVARHVAGVISRTELFSATWRDAREDPLTRLPNRRALDELLGTLVDETATCALAICDLDGFKSINDSLGHAAGDDILRTVATALRAAVSDRLGAVVSRIGGDEFCVLFPHGDLSELQAFGRRVTVDVSVATDDRITATWGAAELSAGDGSSSRLLEAADAALNYAKSLGPGRFSSSAAPALIAGSRERRSDIRVDELDVTSRLLATVIDLVDTHRPPSAVAALEILAVQAQRAVDGAGWAVLRREADSDVLRVVSGRHSELDTASGLWIVGGRRAVAYSLLDLPAVRSAVAERGSVLVAARMDGSDTGDAGHLAGLGCRSALVVVVDGQPTSHLLSIVSTHPVDRLKPIEKVLRVLAHYCVSVTPE